MNEFDWICLLIALGIIEGVALVIHRSILEIYKIWTGKEF
jgi:hypothetical protein